MNFTEAFPLVDPLPGWMTPGELSWLFYQAELVPPGGRWVEVGVWKGRSLAAVLLGLPPGCRLTGADHWRGSPKDIGFLAQAAEPGRTVFRDFAANIGPFLDRRPDVAVELYLSGSLDAARALGPASCDVVFLDGAHDIASVAADVAAWLPCLKPGGILCGHDCWAADVALALSQAGVSWRLATASGSIWVRE